MNKDKYLHFVASFLIVLVLSLPFYTTSVYAAINDVTVKGSDGIYGFAKQNDFLDFSVQASIDNGTITNDRVVLGSGIKFNSCTPTISSGFQCTLRYPASSTQTFEVKLVPFTINLFKSDGTLDDSKSGSVLIDNKPPQVTLSAQQRFSSQSDVVINYDATDSACDDPSCSGQCVGLNNIKFYTEDNSFSQTVDLNASSCNVQSSLSIPTATFSDGKKSIFAKATDKFNQVSPESSVTFEVKTIPPSIISNSFSITKKGITLSTFSNNGVTVDISVNISGSDLDMNSVTADLSPLNPSSKNAKASCTSVEDDASTCTWSVGLNPGQSGLKSILINASDTSGNKAGITINKQLDLDDKGPVLQSLATAASSSSNSSGKLLAKSSGNTVTAVFDEKTGLSVEDVFLTVDQSRIQATSCAKDTNWVCTWQDVNFASSSAKMSISPDSTDILGNSIGSNTPVDVSVDSKPPVLNSINITNIGGLTQAFEGFFKIGDKIAVVANLTEDNDVFATADFSKFISGATNVAGSCQRIESDQHVCTWLTGSINLQASDIITFNFSDNAGNTLIVTRSLKTFGLENAAVPDFWTSTVSCSPSTIDRSLGPLINQRVFCQVLLKPKSSTKPVSTVFIAPATCSGDNSILDNVETLNTDVGSTSPIVKLTLKKDDFRVDNLNLSCSLNIFSKIGSSTTITQNPEIENLNINLQFFNNPLGELSQEVQDKIQKAKDDAAGIWDIIGALNKIVFYAKKICQLFGVLYSIISILYAVAIVLKITTDTTCTNFFTVWNVCPAAFSASTSSCNTQQGARQGAQKGFAEYGQKFCKFVNCQWAPGIVGEYKEWVSDKINSLPGASYVGPTKDGQNTQTDYLNQRIIGVGQPRALSTYLDQQHNLVVATLFACLPGIIYGLEKYRQIKCLYADCLQNAVGKEGLPVTACEDEKAYATCKYVMGEIFALIPYTALLDHFMGIIKNALSNPFLLLGAGVSLLCWATCPAPAPTGTSLYTVCETAKLFSTMGEVIGNVKNIIDNGFTIRTDYCARLDEKDTSTSGSGFTQQTSSGSGVTDTSKK